MENGRPNNSLSSLIAVTNDTYPHCVAIAIDSSRIHSSHSQTVSPHSHQSSLIIYNPSSRNTPPHRKIDPLHTKKQSVHPSDLYPTRASLPYLFHPRVEHPKRQLHNRTHLRIALRVSEDSLQITSCVSAHVVVGAGIRRCRCGKTRAMASKVFGF